MTKRKKSTSKGWSKQARSKGYGVEHSAVMYYNNRGILCFKIPNYLQKGKWRSIDYVVVLKGKLGQGKYKDMYLKGNSKKVVEEKMRIKDMIDNHPNSELVPELAYRNKRYARVKFEGIEW